MNLSFALLNCSSISIPGCEEMELHFVPAVRSERDPEKGDMQGITPCVS